MVDATKGEVLDSRLTRELASARTDDYRREAALHLRARDALPPLETDEDRPRRVASLAATLHIHRPSLRFLRS
jgi:hypothetical protein